MATAQRSYHANARAACDRRERSRTRRFSGGRRAYRRSAWARSVAPAWNVVTANYERCERVPQRPRPVGGRLCAAWRGGKTTALRVLAHAVGGPCVSRYVTDLEEPGNLLSAGVHETRAASSNASGRRWRS